MTVPDQVIEIVGNWGKGGQAIGELFCLKKEAVIFNLKPELKGKILALKGKLKYGFWHKAKSIGTKGIICGGLPDKNFTKELSKEVLKLGQKVKKIALPLVVIGEKGEVPLKAWQVLVQNQGKKVVIEGDDFRVLIPK